MKKNLLIHEPPLQVLPSLAVAVGLTEAIILQQLHYWLENPKAGIERDGYKWIFNTYEEWQANFPFWSVATIRRGFQNLEERGIVIAEQLDKNRHDMTKFYRIAYEQLEQLDGVNLSASNDSKQYDVNKNTETTQRLPEDEDIFLQASNKVDYILEANEKAKTRSWTNLPAQYHDYGRAFFEVTGLKYVKSMAFNCMSTFDEWREAGFSPDDVRRAFAELKAMGKQGMVSQPSSLTWKIRGLAVENNTREVFPCYED
jgi:hypothetical protein